MGKGLNLFAIHPLVGSGSIPEHAKGASIRELLERFVKDELILWMCLAGPEDAENEIVSLRHRIDGESGAMNIGHTPGILGMHQRDCKTKSIPEP